MTQPLSVLLTTEGTYPYFEGGVSTWCDILIRQMPETKFTLMGLTAQPGLKFSYTLPSNVEDCLTVPLWGTGGVNEIRKSVDWYHLHYMQKRLTTKEARETFRTFFELLLTGLLAPEGTLEDLGQGLVGLAQFFRDHDYDAMFRHQMTWDIFQEYVTRCAPHFLMPSQQGTTPGSEDEAMFDTQHLLAQQEPPTPTLHDVIDALRLLYRWLTPIALPIPPVSLIHASSAGLASLPGIIAHREYGTPFLLTEHGVYIRERYLAWARAGGNSFMKLFATRITRRLVEISYAEADLIAPVSSWNLRWETRLGASPERIMTIANGVDPHRFSPQPMPAPETPTIVWVGRIDPLKDLLTLIESATFIRQAIPNVQILLFGKAPAGNEGYEAMCKTRIHELDLKDTIKFMGFAKSPQHAYAQGHIVVLSSISEGLPFSVIEAMFCGRLVVGTDVGGVPEVIGDTGGVVPPRDPKALGEVCANLLSNIETCAAQGERARERAFEQYTLQNLISAHRTVYQQLVTESKSVVPPLVAAPQVPNLVTSLRTYLAPGRKWLQTRLSSLKWALSRRARGYDTGIS